ncbi:uncharacterized protein LOC132041449, partial [Lycium ferocissimum]|uniref:uncharacterized protein LOC132041449 n=1 Tax=Lycium ferocissimum TaxID=112874 RepID=UPI002814F5B0
MILSQSKAIGYRSFEKSLDKVKRIQEKLLAAHSRQKEYANQKVRDLEFMRYHEDGSFIIRWDFVLLDENLSYEEGSIAILVREVHKLRSKETVSVKVQWKNRPVEEATWETKSDMGKNYPQLFTESGFVGGGSVNEEEGAGIFGGGGKAGNCD